jgi:hypothetical protein
MVNLVGRLSLVIPLSNLTCFMRTPPRLFSLCWPSSLIPDIFRRFVRLREVSRLGSIFFPLIFNNLPLRDCRRLVLPEINLVLETIGRVEDCFDNGIDDFSAVHGDADVVADFVGRGIWLLWHEDAILQHVQNWTAFGDLFSSHFPHEKERRGTETVSLHTMSDMQCRFW